MGGMFLLVILCFWMGVVYPVCGVIYYKLIRHDKRTIKQILNEL